MKNILPGNCSALLVYEILKKRKDKALKLLQPMRVGGGE